MERKQREPSFGFGVSRCGKSSKSSLVGGGIERALGVKINGGEEYKCCCQAQRSNWDILFCKFFFFVFVFLFGTLELSMYFGRCQCMCCVVGISLHESWKSRSGVTRVGQKKGDKKYKIILCDMYPV